jgi:hypothetical protein
MDEITRSLKSFSEAIDGTFSTLATKATTGIATGLKAAVPLPRPPAARQPLNGGAAAARPAPQITDEEREAAQKRSDAALAALDQGYFSQSFDPLAHELAALAEDAKQDDVDAVVERLTAAVDVSGQGHGVAAPLACRRAHRARAHAVWSCCFALARTCHAHCLRARHAARRLMPTS